MNRSWIRLVFVVAGLYDVVLGVVFALATGAVFRFFEVATPEYLGYIQYPALLVALFGILFFHIARAPARHRALIWYGIGMKTIYIVLTFWHYLASGLPAMWLPWAWIDLIFLGLFLAAWMQLRAVTTV